MEREQMSIGELTTQRIKPEVTYTVAKPPSNPKTGDLAYFSDGASGSPCWAMYNGSAWVRLSVGATIAAS